MCRKISFKKKLIAAKQGQKINTKFNKYLHIKKRKKKREKQNNLQQKMHYRIGYDSLKL